MTEPLKAQSSLIPENPLLGLKRAAEEQAEATQALVQLVQRLQSEVLALRCLGFALAATHPDPPALLQAYQDQMDHLADLLSPQGVEAHREALQRIQGALLGLVNAQGGQQMPPPSGPAGS